VKSRCIFSLKLSYTCFHNQIVNLNQVPIEKIQIYVSLIKIESRSWVLQNPKKCHKNDSLIDASTNDKELVINYCYHFMFLNKNSSYLQ